LRGHALQAALGDDVAVFHGQLAFKNTSVGLVTNRNKTAMSTPKKKSAPKGADQQGL
jgi:hypothetical protein